MKKRVILFLPSFESGGVERNAVYFANSIVESGYDVYLIYCRKTNEWFSKLDCRVNKVKVSRWMSLPLFHERIVDAVNMLFFSWLPISRICRNGPTVMVSFQSNVIAIFIALISRVPVAVRLSNHSEAVKYEKSFIRKISEYGKRVTYRFANTIIANSFELGKDYESILNKKIEVIYNPVDFDRVNQFKHMEVREELFLNKRRPIVISAGRLSVQKNYQLLLLAMAEVVVEIPCDLVILGEGSEKKHLESLITELGLEGYVHLFGHKGNVYSYFRYSDLFVLCSLYEGMPNVVIEAIACGLPVVSTRCKTGPSEILCDGDGGELVPINDHHALSKAIVRSLSEFDVAMRKQSVAFMNLSRYDLHKVRKQYVSLIEKMLEKCCSPR